MDMIYNCMNSQGHAASQIYAIFFFIANRAAFTDQLFWQNILYVDTQGSRYSLRNAALFRPGR